MDRKTIEERLTLPVLNVCLAVAGKKEGDIRAAKVSLFDVVEDLTKEAVTDHEFHDAFGPAEDAVIKARAAST
jgi:hypothetical protein